MTMETPLKQARALGSAKSGTEHFWQQRLTALANVPLVIFLLWFIVSHLGASRADVIASLTNPFVSGGLILAMACICWHMRIGMQVIIEDYVHGPVAKVAALLGNTIYSAALFIIAVLSILKMSFGV
jgi:succinate dehydrogenase / fumarate reductase membrane anchor subunit